MSDLTELLQHWHTGDNAVRGELLGRVYSELRAIAARHLSGERAGALVQPTALVNEAYLKLSGLDRMQWQSRSHFLAMAARMMREYLVDEARRRVASKRDGGVQVTLQDVDAREDSPRTDMLALNEALERLAKADPDRALLVELRFFGGLTVDETAEVLGRSPATVKRHWQVARAWLFREMASGADNDG
ncbi:MAG: ECF-type sigma factor [Pseudomonadota bacterium]